MITALVDRLKDIRDKLTSATGTVHSELAALRAQIAEKRKEIKHITNAPLPPDEVKARARAEIGARGAAWLREHGNGLLHAGDGTSHPLAGYSSRGRAYLRLPAGVEHDFLGFVAAVDPDLAGRWFDTLIEAVPYAAGPPSAKRPALLEAAERELTALEAAEESAVDEAGRAGVMIEHRPDVLARRATEADRAERERQTEASRLARQQALDADAERRRDEGRVSHSPFLAAGDKPHTW